MEDLSALGRKLESGPMADKLRQAASSPEGQRIMQNLDAEAVEKAAKQGDMQALKNILSSVLATSEGQALAKKIKQSMEGR